MYVIAYHVCGVREGQISHSLSSTAFSQGFKNFWLAELVEVLAQIEEVIGIALPSHHFGIVSDHELELEDVGDG